jgi:glycosyltransferase involved in cell wall biosynthesis
LPCRCVVVIPALNEEACVAKTIQAWHSLGFPRIRLIDNGSTDATAAVARAHGAEVLAEPTRGYGAAAWRGLQDLPASIEWVLFSSADGSDTLDSSELAEWNRAALFGADFILGDRCSHPRSLKTLNPSQRWCTSIFRWCVRWGWNHEFRDVGSLRALRVATFPQLALKDRGFGWNIEMQIRAVECRLRMVELPVLFRPRIAGNSKISGNWRGTLRAAHGILRLLAQLWFTRHHRSVSPTSQPASASAIASASPDRG